MMRGRGFTDSRPSPLLRCGIWLFIARRDRYAPQSLGDFYLLRALEL